MGSDDVPQYEGFTSHDEGGEDDLLDEDGIACLEELLSGPEIKMVLDDVEDVEDGSDQDLYDQADSEDLFEENGASWPDVRCPSLAAVFSSLTPIMDAFGRFGYLKNLAHPSERTRLVGV